MASVELSPLRGLYDGSQMLYDIWCVGVVVSNRQENQNQKRRKNLLKNKNQNQNLKLKRKKVKKAKKVKVKIREEEKRSYLQPLLQSRLLGPESLK
jgi:hypothetical protein